MGALDRIPAWALGSGIGVAFFVAALLMAGRPILPIPGPGDVAPVAAPPAPDTPESLYAGNCAACHQADGAGLPGAFPPLAGSGWATEDVETPIRVLLCGLTGEIEVEGATFNGVMPPLGHLTDQQIAMVLTHVRTSFGNDASAVEPAQVAAVRAALGGRTEMIGGGAELAQMRGE